MPRWEDWLVFIADPWEIADGNEIYLKARVDWLYLDGEWSLLDYVAGKCCWMGEQLMIVGYGKQHCYSADWRCPKGQ